MNNSDPKKEPHWYWQSNPNPYNCDEKKFDAYPKEISDLIQKNFEKKIMNFPIDAVFSIDLMQMMQYKTFEPYRCRPIKCEYVSALPEVENKNECIICGSLFKEIILAPCGHNVFCNPCFQRFCELFAPYDRYCPICKNFIQSFIVQKNE